MFYDEPIIEHASIKLEERVTHRYDLVVEGICGVFTFQNSIDKIYVEASWNMRTC